MKNGIDLIKEEREKQIVKHGYDLKHDSTHSNKELVLAAMSYLTAAYNHNGALGAESWPFDIDTYNFEGYIESLKKAGAFIAAELDRIQLD